jgi:hypothetical protein
MQILVVVRGAGVLCPSLGRVDPQVRFPERPLGQLDQPGSDRQSSVRYSQRERRRFRRTRRCGSARAAGPWRRGIRLPWGRPCRIRSLPEPAQCLKGTPARSRSHACANRHGSWSRSPGQCVPRTAHTQPVFIGRARSQSPLPGCRRRHRHARKSRQLPLVALHGRAQPEDAGRPRYYSASSIRIRRRRKPRPLLSIFVTAMRPIMAVEAT